ncbi:NAD(P)-dependent alcohol dehydrogenase [Snodgrassella alvi]|uniref:NAD(P)-dependent alcohol dehydrogenase n=1 Tax=Snodgrassella alvi TaxID=1196083 RepID=UPI000C1F2F5C|nr:NAD(P)-dependent alcohol dehydrogenase [Snodgrassella alvi]PIT14914.1 alcohol dehydrogenase [Snodgrassella alvi]PIT15480.1 alcohol dehydrogenase [Snodgrassella alvi]
MKAVRLHAKNDIRIDEIEKPKPKAGEILIKIGAAGVCHSDLHLIHMGIPDGAPPFTLGHENAGWIAELGEGVTDFQIGEAVMIYGPWGCGHCAPCQQSMENYCEHQSESPILGGGLGTNGGMAEYMIVPSSRLLIPLHELQPEQVAPLSDAALTPYHAIKRSGSKITPSSFVFVIGIGGLGHMAVQILKKVYSATIIAGDIADDKLELAKKYGADYVVRTDRNTNSVVEEVTHITGVKKCAVVLDFVGNNPTLALGAQTVGLNGDWTVVGLGGGKLDWHCMNQPWGASLCTPYWGSRVELMEVLDLKRKGLIDIEYTTYSLSQALEIYDKLSKGQIKGRAVLIP